MQCCLISLKFNLFVVKILSFCFPFLGEGWFFTLRLSFLLLFVFWVFLCQFAEMERLHMHTIQQLQLELADARERSGTYSDESRISQTNSKDVSQFGQSNGNQLDSNGGGGTSGGNSGVLPNGNSDNVSSFASTGNAPAQVNCTSRDCLSLFFDN